MITKEITGNDDSNQKTNNGQTNTTLSKQVDESHFHVEQIIPGIYLSSSNEYWTPQKLHSHGFTHIIHIDKNINTTQTPLTSATEAANNINSSLVTSESIYDYDVETLDLNFGETYFPAVLPNLYKAVKFIDKALKNGGTILVFDSAGYQKCVTAVVGFLMYKHNISYIIAYELIKTNVELDKFYVSQLYEYEPILQVQRTQSRGHSCSGEIRRASLKRKKTFDDLRPLVDHNITATITYSPVQNPQATLRNSVINSMEMNSSEIMEQ